jgi:hypothetical protein
MSRAFWRWFENTLFRGENRMSTVTPSAVDIWGFLKDLTLRLVADPALLAKVKALWDAIMALFQVPPQAGDPNDVAIVDGWLDEVPPEKLFDGKILAFIAGISTFIDTHPQLIAFLMQILAFLPKEDVVPTV